MTRIAIMVGVLGVTVPNAALADAKAGEAKAILCDLCHNVGAGGQVPLLQGQPAPYLEAQLDAFQTGVSQRRRHANQYFRHERRGHA